MVCLSAGCSDILQYHAIGRAVELGAASLWFVMWMQMLQDAPDATVHRRELAMRHSTTNLVECWPVTDLLLVSCRCVRCGSRACRWRTSRGARWCPARSLPRPSRRPAASAASRCSPRLQLRSTTAVSECRTPCHSGTACRPPGQACITMQLHICSC